MLIFMDMYLRLSIILMISMLLCLQSCPMGLLPDTQYCRLRMRRECRERFPRHRLQRKPLVGEPGMHNGTCVTHVALCIAGLLIRTGGENVLGIPSACATQLFTYPARGPWIHAFWNNAMNAITICIRDCIPYILDANPVNGFGVIKSYITCELIFNSVLPVKQMLLDKTTSQR